MSAGTAAAFGTALGAVRVSAAAGEAANSMTNKIFVFIGCVFSDGACVTWSPPTIDPAKNLVAPNYFAHHFVIASGLSNAVASTICEKPGRAIPPAGSPRENPMKKNTRVIYAVTAGLLLGSTLQSAMATERHRKPQVAPVQQSQSRPTDAYAAWQQPRVSSPVSSYYTGGYSAPAGH
jgi:hypothetical protein